MEEAPVKFWVMGANEWRYADDWPLPEGAKFFDEASDHGLEGVVSKRADSTYIQGRSKTWLKAKAPTEIVGSKRDCHACPLATFYNDKSGGNEVDIPFASWRAVTEVLGPLAEHPGSYPTRYFVESFPDAAQLARMQQLTEA